MVVSSQAQPARRQETAPSTGSRQAAGAARGRRKLRHLRGSGGHTRAGRRGTGGAGAHRQPLRFSPPRSSLGNGFPGLRPGPLVSSSSCTIGDSQRSLGMCRGHESWGWDSRPGGSRSTLAPTSTEHPASPPGYLEGNRVPATSDGQSRASSLLVSSPSLQQRFRLCPPIPCPSLAPGLSWSRMASPLHLGTFTPGQQHLVVNDSGFVCSSAGFSSPSWVQRLPPPLKVSHLLLPCPATQGLGSESAPLAW